MGQAQYCRAHRQGRRHEDGEILVRRRTDRPNLLEYRVELALVQGGAKIVRVVNVVARPGGRAPSACLEGQHDSNIIYARQLVLNDTNR